MVGFSSVCLYGRSTAAAAAVGGFAAERFAGRRRRSTAAGAVQQSPALSRPRSESDIYDCLSVSVRDRDLTNAGINAGVVSSV